LDRRDGVKGIVFASPHLKITDFGLVDVDRFALIES
jgi:hypothetical protein